MGKQIKFSCTYALDVDSTRYELPFFVSDGVSYSFILLCRVSLREAISSL